ncbi:RNA recognition motif containing protein [Purpureocillium lilacinum]|uniref:RNA recognition motif containing protein n=1 Tax=Purpureocillium lilacinum TaxID=33203 RepID=A0A2U3EID2_PURLI|nr:RNA recognition motif containing protein [Purpureocillium lilacinum]
MHGAARVATPRRQGSLTPDCRRWAGGQPWSSIAGTCPGSDTCSAGAAAPVTSRRQPHPPANRRLLPAPPQIGFVSRACDRERLTQRTSLIIVHAPQQTPRAQFLTALNARRHPWHLTRLDAPYTSYLPAKSIGDSCLCQGRRPQIPTMSSRPPSRVVFVGNIPYGLSEEQITDIFSSAGKVERFRLVYDSETGRPKGFGFADYPDTDSAASAVRNLNDYEIMGRKLRVDFSNEQKSGDDDNNQTSIHVPTAANGAGPSAYGSQASSLPPLPAGKEIPPGLTCTDAISRTLNTLPPPQLLDILGQMKALATSDPQRATELLQQAPQLTYAVFQSLLLMGLVSPEAIQSVSEPGAPPAVPQPAAGFPAPIPGYPAANNTPPVAGAPYAPPPAAAQGYGAPAPAAAPQDTDALIRQVMELPQAQIDLLPEAERQQILALRATFGAQQRR